jgi:nitroreductase
MDLNKAIKARHSVRKFKEKRPDWRDILDCLESARYAPTAGNNSSVRFIVVDDENKIKEIAAACQQQFVGEAKYLVIVCSTTRRIISSYGEEMGKNFIRQQAGAAIENFLLSIEEKGLATCWVGYFIEDIIKRVLKVPEASQIEAILPIGFEFDKKHIRQEKPDLDNFLYFNSYGDKHQKPWKKFDV